MDYLEFQEYKGKKIKHPVTGKTTFKRTEETRKVMITQHEADFNNSQKLNSGFEYEQVKPARKKATPKKDEEL